jgi:hypothetical protein
MQRPKQTLARINGESGMTVEELMAELERHPKDAQVYVYEDRTDCKVYVGLRVETDERGDVLICEVWK